MIINEPGSVLIGAALVNNIVLVQMLGVSPLANKAGSTTAALALTAASGLVLVLATVFAWISNAFILLPLQLEYLQTLLLIMLIAAIAVSSERIACQLKPALATYCKDLLPWVIGNAAIAGLLLSAMQQNLSFGEALLSSIGAAIGFAVVLLLFTGLYDRLRYAAVPVPFQGAAISLITLGLMALAFMGFTGLVAV